MITSRLCFVSITQVPACLDFHHGLQSGNQSSRSSWKTKQDFGDAKSDPFNMHYALILFTRKCYVFPSCATKKHIHFMQIPKSQLKHDEH
mmetsp:Transcript_48937/g.147424  ORF Transcript_48937/g.147424 Transcript_48937/m.147424 type:complete len:90 (-) Transcript_48937:71-340(-)